MGGSEWGSSSSTSVGVKYSIRETGISGTLNWIPRSATKLAFAERNSPVSVDHFVLNDPLALVLSNICTSIELFIDYFVGCLYLLVRVLFRASVERDVPICIFLAKEMGKILLALKKPLFNSV